MDHIGDLLRCGLTDLMQIEGHSRRSLDRLVELARRDEVERLLRHHGQRTERQLRRLDRSLALVGCDGDAAGDESCPPRPWDPWSEGLGSVGDLLLLAHARRLVRHEITLYEQVIQWGRVARCEAVATMLQDTLAEEEEADRELRACASRLLDLQDRRMGAGSSLPDRPSLRA